MYNHTICAAFFFTCNCIFWFSSDLPKSRVLHVRDEKFILSATDSPEENESTQFEIEVENDPTFVSNDETRETQEFNQNVEVKTEEVADAEKSEENGEYTPDDVTEFVLCFL